MKLWRLTLRSHVLLDGSGAMEHGGRYSSKGRPVVNFASEPGLAVLIVLRYLMRGSGSYETERVLGSITIDTDPERLPDALTDADRIKFVDDWLASLRSLTLSVPSNVLPEANVVLLNPRHAEASRFPILHGRAFRFTECLHRPPMLDTYLRTEPPGS